jgi:hypothetical protein
VLAAAGFNFSLLLRWLAEHLRALIRALAEILRRPPASVSAWILVVRPPRERPIASPYDPLFRR